MHLWAGIDAGKAHDHCVVIDADGNRLVSQRVPNDEPALLQLLAGVLELAAGDEVVWATDLNHGGPALLIAKSPRRRAVAGPPWQPLRLMGDRRSSCNQTQRKHAYFSS